MQKWLVFLLLVIALSAGGWWLYTTELLRINSFSVSGLNEIELNEIHVHMEGVVGKHFLEMLVAPPTERLKVHPWVKEASVSLKFPSEMVIRIIEREAIALIPYFNYYLSVDDEGKLLSLHTSLSSETDSLPFITGLSLPLLAVGESIPRTPNFISAVGVLSQLEEQQRRQIAEVDVSSALQVILRSIDNIIIDVGEGKRLFEKNSYFLEILNYVRNNELVNGKILVGSDTIVWCYDGDLPDEENNLNEEDENVLSDDYEGN